MNSLFQENREEVEPEDSTSDENGLALKLAKMLVTLLETEEHGSGSERKTYRMRDEMDG